MKILYDGEIYSIFQRGGVVRYFHNLISRLPKQCQPIILGNQDLPEVPTHPNLNQHIYANRWVPSSLKFVRKSFDRRYCRAQLRNIQPDVIHPTYFQNVARGRYDQVGVPLVLTVYDMIHERFAAQIDKSGKHSAMKRAAVERADHIICISETTRNDLIHYFDVAPERTSVTLLAVEPQFDQRTESSVRRTDSEIQRQKDFADSISVPNDPYFVFVGRRDLYKNWDRLVEAFELVLQKSPELKLTVVGSEFSAEEKQFLRQHKVERSIVHLGTVDDATLIEIYHRSLGFIFPTLWEGFGLPLLEGIASGTCVLASDIPVFREIAGGGFQPFDPYSAESMADAMLQVADSPTLREKRVTAGQQLLQHFDWTTTATQTFEIYQKLIKNH